MILGSAKAVTLVLTTNLERAKAFYEGKLGLSYLAKDDYALLFDLNRATLRVTFRGEHEPSEHAVLGWMVPDIRRAVEDLKMLGIEMERYPFLPQDDMGIWTSPDGVAQVAFF